MNAYRDVRRLWMLALVLLMVFTTGCIGGGPKATTVALPTATATQPGGEPVGATAFPPTFTPPAEGAAPTSDLVQEPEPTLEGSVATETSLPADAAATETPLPAEPAGAVATSTVAPTSAPATAAAIAEGEDVYEPIPGCARSRLHWGDIIRIVPEIEYVRIRSTADTSPSDNIVRKWYRSELAQITGLPRCNYGWIIWPIRTADNTKGWVPESNGTTFWLMKVRGFFPTEVPPSR